MQQLTVLNHQNSWKCLQQLTVLNQTKHWFFFCNSWVCLQLLNIFPTADSINPSKTADKDNKKASDSIFINFNCHCCWITTSWIKHLFLYILKIFKSAVITIIQSKMTNNQNSYKNHEKKAKSCFYSICNNKPSNSNILSSHIYKQFAPSYNETY